MRRFQNRVTFRLSDQDFIDYRGLIGHIYGVHSWTDLMRFSLREALLAHKARGEPLHHVPAVPDPGLTSDRVSDKSTVITRTRNDSKLHNFAFGSEKLPKPSRNGTGKREKKKKKLDKGKVK